MGTGLALDGGSSLRSCRGFPDVLARHLSVFPCREGNFGKIIQSKMRSCTQAVLRSWSEAFSACGGGFFLHLTNFVRPSEPSPLLPRAATEQTAPAHRHREVFTLSVHLRPIFSASAASITAISKIFVLQELDFSCWREPEPHILGGPGCLWRPQQEGPLVSGSYTSPVPQELSRTPCQHSLPELPNVAMAPGLCF